MTYLVYIEVTTILIVSLLGGSYLLSPRLQGASGEKVSPYECGFEPLSDTRQKFDVSFMCLAILFIIFDLEIVFLLPGASVLGEVNLWGSGITIIFILILTLGFVMEFISGALTGEG